MKSPPASFLHLSLMGLMLLAHPASAQGPLAPPAGPQPMMKTLQEMEPRTHIAAAGYVISAPGSYYLTANLNGGGTQNGITVNASGVTIDLRGFSIENCQTGISAGAGVGTVVVANGSVRDCNAGGVDLSAASLCRLEGVIVSANAGDGASVGAGSLVTLCTASGNGGRGLVLGNNGTVFRCVAQNNASGGIAIASNCQATENTCTGNGSGTGQAGLLASGSQNRVEGNSANYNNGQGFLINGTGNLVVRNNACSNTVADYTIASGNNYGQILLSPGSAFASSNAWANIGCGTQPGDCQTAAECDDANPCTEDICMANVCVNPVIPGCGPCQTAAQCDDGNPCTEDVCQAGACVHNPIPGCGAPICGNGVIENGEQCDDGNTNNGDGCSSSCQNEGGGVCTDGSTQACYAGPAGTLGVGACQAGTQTCSGGYWGACVGQTTPNAEVCDSIDNDCDGQVDEGLGTISCGVGVCMNTVSACVNGQEQSCSPGIPSVEVCDGLDNDCDGMVDEGGVCGGVCGNGVVEGGETCDDQNQTNGDGCSAACTIEPGYSCAGSPSACSDLNECIVNNGGCSPNATCTNFVGSYSCTCGPGYIGDGFTCVAIGTCSDGIQNGFESGVDCGGGTCAPCVNGQGCNTASDCASGVCSGGVCTN